MADPKTKEEMVELLRSSLEEWNVWKKNHPALYINLREVDLSETYLGKVNLSQANLSGANLREADLREADLRRATLLNAYLPRVNLYGANLSEADLREANLSEADLRRANLSHALLRESDLRGTYFGGANLSEVDLTKADLRCAVLVNTNLTNAVLTGSCVYGISAWNVILNGTRQSSLVITARDEPVITVDNLEVAQFIYLLLNNPKIREVIDTIGKKAVLILGRFTQPRIAILDALRDSLRKLNYIPILFDFERSTTRDLTETIVTLAHLSRFIIADLTDPSSIPKELEAIIPTLAVPVLPLLAAGAHPYAMFVDNWKYEWVLQTYVYEGLESLINHLPDKVIGTAERKATELEKRRNAAFRR